MFQIHCPKGRAVLAVLLLTVLAGGCDAIYDDTKGWAGRLEASLLSMADDETAGPAPDAATPPPPGDAVAAARPGEMAPPPAVPVEPVATLALAAPGAQPAAAPAAPAEATAPATTPDRVAAPQGAMAAASEALLAGAAEPAAKAAEPAALPPTPKPKPEPPKLEPNAPAAAKAAEGVTDEAVVAVVLHLSSLRSEEAAQRQWSDLQQSFPEPLGQLQAEFQRTDLGDKGTFYRVLAGPLPSRDEATQVCAALKAKDARQYCRILPSKPKA